MLDSIIADKYDVLRLRAFAKLTYKKAIHEEWHKDSMGDFVASLKEFYEIPITRLRQWVIGFVIEHTQELLTNAKFVDLFLDNSDLALEFVTALRPLWKECPECKSDEYVYVQAKKYRSTEAKIYRCSRCEDFD
jgi:DNA-directed RNA polymerase subunit M/transcription elongation factor TFIIS